MGAPIDWQLASSIGARVAPSGPELSEADTLEAVESLRYLSTAAVQPVQERSGLTITDDVAGARPAIVVDRPTWINRNIASFETLLVPILQRMASKSPGVVTSVGSRLTGLQLGLVLGYLSGKVLGQFDPFASSPPNERLMLVAPNIVATERALGVDGRDFRLWVCLHEETHRVQFGAVPWLTDHLLRRIHTYLELADVDTAELLRRVRASPSALVDTVRGGRGVSLLDVAQSPAQRVVFDELSAVMSLLEGHAEYVMDEVGPDVVPTVEFIRSRFDQRRRSPSGLDAITRRLLGLDIKLAQYTEGAAFVRGVVDRVGLDGFNAVWDSPKALPTLPEIADPSAWCARVVG